jgi:hypothetical protein
MTEGKELKAQLAMDALDDAAVAAQDDLTNLNQEAIEVVAEWWKKWYLQAGHKRLGRILIGKY